MESCWSVFFWSWTTGKKSRSDPQGRSRSSSRMRTLRPELTISLPPPTVTPASPAAIANGRESLECGDLSPLFLAPREDKAVPDAWALGVQERLRIAAAAQEGLSSHGNRSRRGRKASAAQTGQRDPCEKNFPENAPPLLTGKVTCSIPHKEGAGAPLVLAEAFVGVNHQTVS